jgi:hypothetical protein
MVHLVFSLSAKLYEVNSVHHAKTNANNFIVKQWIDLHVLKYMYILLGGSFYTVVAEIHQSGIIVTKYCLETQSE